MKRFIVVCIAACSVVLAPAGHVQAFGGHGGGHGGFFFHHGGGSFSLFAFRAGPPVAIIKDLFFCFPHGLGFIAQDTFFAHLQDIHGISPGRAPAYLIRTGPRLIFLGF